MRKELPGKRERKGHKDLRFKRLLSLPHQRKVDLRRHKETQHTELRGLQTSATTGTSGPSSSGPPIPTPTSSSSSSSAPSTGGSSVVPPQQPPSAAAAAAAAAAAHHFLHRAAVAAASSVPPPPGSPNSVPHPPQPHPHPHPPPHHLLPAVSAASLFGFPSVLHNHHASA